MSPRVAFLMLGEYSWEGREDLDFDMSCVPHRWYLPVLHYHEILVIYPYPFFGNYPIVLLYNIS